MCITQNTERTIFVVTKSKHQFVSDLGSRQSWFDGVNIFGL